MSHWDGSSSYFHLSGKSAVHLRFWSRTLRWKERGSPCRVTISFVNRKVNVAAVARHGGVFFVCLFVKSGVTHRHHCFCFCDTRNWRLTASRFRLVLCRWCEEALWETAWRSCRFNAGSRERREFAPFRRAVAPVCLKAAHILTLFFLGWDFGQTINDGGQSRTCSQTS